MVMACDANLQALVPERDHAQNGACSPQRVQKALQLHNPRLSTYRNPVRLHGATGAEK